MINVSSTLRKGIDGGVIFIVCEHLNQLSRNKILESISNTIPSGLPSMRSLQDVVWVGFAVPIVEELVKSRFGYIATLVFSIIETYVYYPQAWLERLILSMPAHLLFVSVGKKRGIVYAMLFHILWNTMIMAGAGYGFIIALMVILVIVNGVTK